MLQRLMAMMNMQGDSTEEKQGRQAMGPASWLTAAWNGKTHRVDLVAGRGRSCPGFAPAHPSHVPA